MIIPPKIVEKTINIQEWMDVASELGGLNKIEMKTEIDMYWVSVFDFLGKVQTGDFKLEEMKKVKV